MKIKVELKNGITAELTDYDAQIMFVSVGEGSEMTMPIDELQDVLDVMKGASSMYRQELDDTTNDDKLTEREELGLLRQMVTDGFKKVDINRMKPNPDIDDTTEQLMDDPGRKKTDDFIEKRKREFEEASRQNAEFKRGL